MNVFVWVVIGFAGGVLFCGAVFIAIAILILWSTEGDDPSAAPSLRLKPQKLPGLVDRTAAPSMAPATAGRSPAPWSGHDHASSSSTAPLQGPGSRDMFETTFEFPPSPLLPADHDPFRP